MSQIRIVIADDELLFRKCVLALLRAPDIEVVGEAADAVQAVAKVRELRPDVILLDLAMPGTDGGLVTNTIHRQFPEVRILVLASSDNDGKLFSALQSGARGHILKDAAPEELLTAIRGLYNGHVYLHPPIARKALTWLDRPPDVVNVPASLTKRQREVLALVAQGYSNLEIGNRLVITEHAASKHVSSILGKLHLTHRVQAALYAAHNGQMQSGLF